MTLREFIYARLREEEQVAASQLLTAQAMGPDGLYMFPRADLKLRAAKEHREVLVWVIERRLWDVPRIARVQTMKALACRWRGHPDYLSEWSPA